MVKSMPHYRYIENTQSDIRTSMLFLWMSDRGFLSKWIFRHGYYHDHFMDTVCQTGIT